MKTKKIFLSLISQLSILFIKLCFLAKHLFSLRDKNQLACDLITKEQSKEIIDTIHSF